MKMIYQKTDLELVVAVFAVLEFSWGVAGKWPLGDRPLPMKTNKELQPYIFSLQP